MPLPVAARAFAMAGVPVFPCAPRGKRPLAEHGFRDATTELAQIEAWWSRFPEANIGMPTGRASGVVIVDVDVTGGVNGYDGFDRARRAGLVSGWGLLTRSPSGGMHAYFPAVSGVVQRSWQAARAGIDFRGDGGYVVVPPSAQHLDGEYRQYRVEQFTSDAVHPVDAQRLREFLDPKPPVQWDEPVEPGRTPNVERLAAWVARRPEGERNLGLFKAACRLAEHGTPPRNALDALGAAAVHAGLGAQEITRTIGSAYRHVHTYGPSRRAPAQDAEVFSHRPEPAAAIARGW